MNITFASVCVGLPLWFLVPSQTLASDARNWALGWHTLVPGEKAVIGEEAL